MPRAVTIDGLKAFLDLERSKLRIEGTQVLCDLEPQNLDADIKTKGGILTIAFKIDGYEKAIQDFNRRNIALNAPASAEARMYVDTAKQTIRDNFPSSGRTSRASFETFLTHPPHDNPRGAVKQAIKELLEEGFLIGDDAELVCPSRIEKNPR